jgi:cytidine deaminase
MTATDAIDWESLRERAREAIVMSGGGKLVAFTCVDGHGATLMPCGRCRQLLYEHSAEGMLLETVSGVKTIDEVLPDAFGPRQLAEFSGGHA